MTRWAMGVEYDGTYFCGWQHQPGLRTLEDTFAKAIGSVADHAISLICGGRTDAGVHAAGQVIHFDSEAVRSPRAWVLGTNANLDHKASVRWAIPVPEYFHARFSATRRHYRYTIFNRTPRSALYDGRATWVHAPLDIVRMHESAQYLVGEHDFSAFRAVECQSSSPIRRIDHLLVQREGEVVHIDVAANAFLHHMVRNIAGLLIEVGRGLHASDEVKNLLEGRDRRRNAPTAEPDGLCLRRIEYPKGFELPDPV